MRQLRVRSQLRTHLLLAAVAACLLPAMAQPALVRAADLASVKITFAPDRPGAQISIHTTMTIRNSEGGLPSPVIGFDLHLPPQLELITSTMGLAICQPEPLLADGLSGCSPNARLGSGTAYVAVPFGPEVATATANIQLLMGPPVGEQVGVLLYAESRTPVFAQLVFPGQLLDSSGPETLSTTFPPTPTLPGAPDAAMTTMSLEVGPENLTYYEHVHGREVSFHPTGPTLPRKCPRGGYLFVTNMRFEDGTKLTVPYAVPCPPSSRDRRR